MLNINVKFWKTYEIGESKMLYGVEIWTVKEGWKYTDGIHGGFFFKKVVRNPRSAENVAAEWELGSEGRKGKTLCSIVYCVTGIC